MEDLNRRKKDIFLALKRDKQYGIMLAKKDCLTFVVYTGLKH